MFQVKQLRFAVCVATGFAAIITATAATAEGELAGGFWGNYAYTFSADDPDWGHFGYGAFIVYATGEFTSENGTFASALEARFGPGSFSDPDNNFTGTYATAHQAWVSWSPNDKNTITLGKSQLPFGWKSYNFWPGDMLLAGYGDQMDVGLKYTGEINVLMYDLAWYHSDDFGHSTDTVDDNSHWGSTTTYRKINTWVGQLKWQANSLSILGIAIQSGNLQDLGQHIMSGTTGLATDGDHRAGELFYEFDADPIFSRFSYILAERNLPPGYALEAALPPQSRSARLSFDIGYKLGNWTLYLDATAARSRSPGPDAGIVTAWAPGARYDYGPGWIYIEALIQDGDFDRDGHIVPGDFQALYVSLDFYF